jgi:ubiquinone/menaquinone biosynthesis C-methylase UbiE
LVPQARPDLVESIERSFVKEPPDRSPAPEETASRPLATYEDLGYRDVFWASRAYEDACDRVALRALLAAGAGPAGRTEPHGRLVEVGAGFGRLANEYGAFAEVVLVDASEVHVRAAREQLATDRRIEVRLGDALALPAEDGAFDVAVMVRVLHHFSDPEPVVRELARVVRPGGYLVLEYANKRNLKSIARRVLRRQGWSPFEPGSVEYRPFHHDHAPSSVRRALRRTGFTIERTRAVSLFRLPFVTRHLSPLLVQAEAVLQEPIGGLTPGPSVFVLARRV